MIGKSFLKKMVTVMGVENVLLEAERLEPYSSDAKITGIPPLAAVRPGRAADVRTFLAACREERIPVVTRGAGTGMVGGAVPDRPSIVLDLTRMNRIGEIDPVSMTVRAEAGVITEHLQKTVEKIGLFYPPDPASADKCTIGGNAATNAGGLRAVKYGVTGNYILGVDAVLADGRLLKTGVRTRKGVVGFDLCHLLVGSEGMLAVICELTLRLLRKPPAVRTMIASFKNIEDCGRGVAAILGGDVLPAAIEFIDEESVRAVEKTGKGPMPYKAPFLLIEVDGRDDTVAWEIAKLNRLLASLGAKTHAAAGDAESKSIWDARRVISEALKEASPKKMSEDVTVPISQLVKLMEGIRGLADRWKLVHAAYGHAGDGNLHVNVLFDPAEEGIDERVADFRSGLFDLTLELGGTISGEHGIGLAKREFIGRELSATSLEMHRHIKSIFDPDNILNPGKIWMEKG